MDQYVPQYKACEYEDINRILTGEEFDKVTKKAKDFNLNFIA